MPKRDGDDRTELAAFGRRIADNLLVNDRLSAEARAAALEDMFREAFVHP